MLTVSDIFKYSIVISMSEKRLQILQKAFTAEHLPLPSLVLEPSRGYNYESKTLDCKHSHGKAIQYAADNDWPFVLIFEDDAWPRIDCIKHIERNMQILPNKHIYAVTLGWGSVQTYGKKYGTLKPVLKMTGTQAYIAFKPAYKKLIRAFAGNTFKPQADAILGCHAYYMLGFVTFAADILCFTQYNFKDEPLKDKRTRWCIGYCQGNDSFKDVPPDGFNSIENITNITNKNIVNIQQILKVNAKSIQFKL